MKFFWTLLFLTSFSLGCPFISQVREDDRAFQHTQQHIYTPEWIHVEGKNFKDKALKWKIWMAILKRKNAVLFFGADFCRVCGALKPFWIKKRFREKWTFIYYKTSREEWRRQRKYFDRFVPGADAFPSGAVIIGAKPKMKIDRIIKARFSRYDRCMKFLLAWIRCYEKTGRIPAGENYFSTNRGPRKPPSC